MVKIKVSCDVNKDADTTFQVVKKFDKYKEFMEGIISINIQEQSGNLFITEWQIDFDGAPFYWVEEEIIHDNTRTILFKSIKGDFYLYCGEWHIIEVGKNKSRIALEAYFNWGIPNMEKFIGQTLKRKAKKALKGMVLSFRKVLN